MTDEILTDKVKHYQVQSVKNKAGVTNSRHGYVKCKST